MDETPSTWLNVKLQSATDSERAASVPDDDDSSKIYQRRRVRSNETLLSAFLYGEINWSALE